MFSQLPWAIRSPPFRSVVEFDPPHKFTSIIRWERLIKSASRMRVHLIANQNDIFRRRAVACGEASPSPTPSRLWYDVDGRPPCASPTAASFLGLLDRELDSARHGFRVPVPVASDVVRVV